MGDSSINKVDMSLDDIIKLNKKTKKGVSPLNRKYQSKPQLNLSQTSRTRRNNNNNIQNQINQSPGTKRPRINRNYGNNLSLAQLGNNTGQKLNKKFSASYISLSSTSGVSNVRNGQGNRQRGQRRRNNQWNNNDQSFDDTITVSVPNNQQNRRRNKKQKKFTNVSLSERFTNNNERRNKTQQWGRQVFY